MKKVLFTIALLSSGMLNAVSGHGAIGGNPATWTPLADISTFHVHLPKPPPTSTIVMPIQLPNVISVGQGFQVSENGSTGENVKVSTSPGGLFKRINATPKRNPGFVGGATTWRYVAQKTGTAEVKVSRSFRGKRQPTKTYIFRIWPQLFRNKK